jgi:hypothetical protein
MTKKRQCPVITAGGNGGQERLSAYWVIGDGGVGHCLRYRDGQCGLTGGACPFGGERVFETTYRYENIFSEKGYLGGIHSRGLPRSKHQRVWV